MGLKPIVDTIQEHEKYGNTGEQHRKIAHGLVDGFEALGNVVSTVVDVSLWKTLLDFIWFIYFFNFSCRSKQKTISDVR